PGDELRDLFRPRVEPRAELEQHRRAVRGPAVLPVALVEGAPRGADGPVDGGGIRRRRAADEPAVRGRVRLEPVAVVAPRAADQMAGLVHLGDHASTSNIVVTPSSSSSAAITSGGE